MQKLAGGKGKRNEKTAAEAEAADASENFPNGAIEREKRQRKKDGDGGGACTAKKIFLCSFRAFGRLMARGLGSTGTGNYRSDFNILKNINSVKALGHNVLYSSSCHFKLLTCA